MDKRAIVLEVGARHATVLVDGGDIRKIPLTRGSLTVGQQVSVPGETTTRLPLVASAAALAAVVIGGGVLLQARALPTAVGVVSVDINPSLDLAVAQSGEVVGVTGLDPAGRRLATQHAFVGESVTSAVRTIATLARDDGYLNAHNPIVLLAGGIETTKAGDGTALRNLLKQADAALMTAAAIPSEHVVVLPLASEAQVTAAAADKLSLGRYMVAKMTGLPIKAAGQESIPRLLGKWPGTSSFPGHVGGPSGTAHGKSHKGNGNASGTVPPVTKTSPGTTPVGPPSPGGATNAVGNATGSLTNSTGNSVGGSGRVGSPSPVNGRASQSGNLQGVGPGVLVVDGVTYALAPYAMIKANGTKAPITLPLILQALGDEVTLRFNQSGQVVEVRVLKTKGAQNQAKANSASSGG
ncbi:MAG: anti-sigma-I factor RsgI family protein [Gemmataceae bacterium]